MVEGNLGRFSRDTVEFVSGSAFNACENVTCFVHFVIFSVFFTTLMKRWRKSKKKCEGFRGK